MGDISARVSRRDIDRRVARSTRTNLKVVKKVIDAFLEEVKRAVLEEEQMVVIPGFGTFYLKNMAPRVGTIKGKEFAVGFRQKLAFKTSRNCYKYPKGSSMYGL